MAQSQSKTLEDFLGGGGVGKELGEVILTLAAVCVDVYGALGGGGAAAEGKMGYTGDTNVTGDQQVHMDVIANDLFVAALRKNKQVALLASEELADAVDLGRADGYSVAFDPLDGSSIVDVNFSVGSIIGIYPGKGFIGRKGSEQVASMIAVHGPRLSLFLALNGALNEFLYHPSEERFFLSVSNVKISEEGKYFAPGNLRACKNEHWYGKLVDYWVDEGYTLRYSGGMVPDINHILLKGGGVFTYPGTSQKPEGKLRLLYECAPMAFLIEAAGGSAESGHGRILDIPIDHAHQKTPIFLGSKKEVQKVLSMMKKS